ncbi:MAG: hypothetical protein ACRD9L_19405 [Bryobacteraceae bacterium]
MLKYRVTFMERTNANGDPSEDPRGYLDANLSSGIVLDTTFIERTKPTATHVEDRLEEDDDFLSVGSETWEYDVADRRRQEFLGALRNSQMVIEFVEVGEPAAVSSSLLHGSQ